MRSKEGKDLLKELGKFEKVGPGEDSTVYRIREADGNVHIVNKEYDNIVHWAGEEKAERILGQYSTDTFNADSALRENSNPLHQILEIDGQEFSVEYQMLPQGSVLIKGDDSILNVVGQEYVSGHNLHKFEQEIDLPNILEEQVGLKKNTKLIIQLSQYLKELSLYLSKELDTHVNIVLPNVKVFINHQDKTVKVVISDFAYSLEEYFKESPKFK